MQISYLHHLERVAPVVRQRQEKIEYYRIAAHYRFILRTMFDCFRYPRLIILEVSKSCLYGLHTVGVLRSSKEADASVSPWVPGLGSRMQRAARSTAAMCP